MEVLHFPMHKRINDKHILSMYLF